MDGLNGLPSGDKDINARIEVDIDGQISQEQMRLIHDRVQDVLDHAPSDASAELSVHREDSSFRGSLKLHSQQRQFSGEQESSDFDVVLDELFEQIEDQLEEWHRQRKVDSGSSLSL